MSAKIQSQTLNHINENNYDDDITVENIEKGWFPAVTSNTLNDQGTQREMTVTLLELDASPGGTMSTNSGLYIRQANEASVKATLMKEGAVLDTNVQDYA